MDNADKLTETEMLRLQVAALSIDNAAKAHALAMQARDALSAELLRKYGAPGDTTLNYSADGTIMRAPKLVPTEQEVSGG